MLSQLYIIIAIIALDLGGNIFLSLTQFPDFLPHWDTPVEP